MHGCFHSLAQMPGPCPSSHPVSGTRVPSLGGTPEVAACRLASGCRHRAQSTEGPYTRQAVPGHPSPCCRRVPRPGRYSRREAALHVRRAGGAPGRGGVRGARLSSAPCARRPPAEPPRSRGGGAASPVPGAGWRRARTLRPELGAPPAGTPAGLPRGEGLDAQVTSRVPRPFPPCLSHAVPPGADQLE